MYWECLFTSAKSPSLTDFTHTWKCKTHSSTKGKMLPKPRSKNKRLHNFHHFQSLCSSVSFSYNVLPFICCLNKLSSKLTTFVNINSKIILVKQRFVFFMQEETTRKAACIFRSPYLFSDLVARTLLTSYGKHYPIWLNRECINKCVWAYIHLDVWNFFIATFMMF